MNYRPTTGRRLKVLVADGEASTLGAKVFMLDRDGFEALSVKNGLKVLPRAEDEIPDLFILSATLPHLDGLTLCRQIRRHERLRTVPIILLAEAGDEQAHIHGLNAGADICLLKPVSPRILSSQIRALLRATLRYSGVPDIVMVDDLEIDRTRYAVYRLVEDDRTSIHFPRQQFELLHFLAAHPGKVFTREALIDTLWTRDPGVIQRTVDVHVRKIRQKLGSSYIETVKGIGYRFKDID